MTAHFEDNALPKCDLRLSLDSELGKKILNSLEFPLHLNFFPETEDEANGYDIDGPVVLDEIQTDALHTEDRMTENDVLDAVVEDVVVGPVLDYHSLAANEPKKTHSDATGEEESTCATEQEEEDPPRAKTPRSKVIITSLLLVVPSAPTVVVGDPIRISDITFDLRAKVKICFRTWGKWRCVNASTGWVKLTGREATLNLSSSGTEVYAAPEVGNMDVLVSVKIVKWRYKFRLGITKILNRKLLQRGPIKILELAGIQNKMLFPEKTPRFEVLGFSESKEGLVVSLNLSLI